MSNVDQENPSDNDPEKAPKSTGPAPKVGYKQPPVHTRFQPGQSGNPKGRRKGTPNYRTTVERVINETVSVREGNKTRRMTKGEAMLQANILKGMKGDPRSTNIVLSCMGKTGLLADDEDTIKGAEPQQPANLNEVAKPGDALFSNIDKTLLSKEELIELSKLAEIIDLGGGITALSVDQFQRLKDITNKGMKGRAAA